MGELFNQAPISDLSPIIDCPCLDCKHEFFMDCISYGCECCALEDYYFRTTGD